mmetsp:Transcript_7067/g.10565  ORF Transcript_7067/g.10565 Transcript_7067/m.10565 type:complete len:142 (+) Transcript_7067:44-469(+)
MANIAKTSPAVYRGSSFGIKSSSQPSSLPVHPLNPWYLSSGAPDFSPRPSVAKRLYCEAIGGDTNESIDTDSQPNNKRVCRPDGEKKTAVDIAAFAAALKKERENADSFTEKLFDILTVNMHSKRDAKAKDNVEYNTADSK